MKVAVVTPIYEPSADWLRTCLESVKAQRYPCDHFLVNDGDDSITPTEFSVAAYSRIQGPHNDYGNVARAVGSVLAIAKGYDAIAFLDADNWYEPGHIHDLIELHKETSSSICTASRNLIDVHGELLGRCPECDGERFVDTSSLIIFRDRFDLIPIWYGMPIAVAAIGDKVFWREVLRRNVSRAHSPRATVNYRTNYRAHYFHFGRVPPAGAKHVFMHVTPSGDYISATTQTYPIASHDISEAQQAPSCRRMRVSLCMIVKNEADNLGQCLESVRGVFDEIIVVDTGSTDGTTEIARRHGGQVFNFPWIDDFSAARNESLRHATGDWVLWLDADEHFDGADLRQLRDLFDQLSDDDRCYLMRQRSLPDRITGSTLVVDQVRLFRRSPGTRWTSRIHEQVTFETTRQPTVVTTKIQILHRGYQEMEVRRHKRHATCDCYNSRSKTILKTPLHFIALQARNSRLGTFSRQFAFYADACKWLRRNAPYKPKAVYLLAETFHRIGQIDQALDVCRAGKRDFNTFSELWFQEGLLLYSKGDFAAARQCLETFVALPEGESYCGRELELREFRARDYLAHLYLRSGLEKDAETQWKTAVERVPQCIKAWLALLELYIVQKRIPDTEALMHRASQALEQEALVPILNARLDVARGRVSNARVKLEKVIESHPTLLLPRVFLSDILLRLTNDVAAAEQQLRSILTLIPNEPETQNRLAALLVTRPTAHESRVD